MKAILQWLSLYPFLAILYPLTFLPPFMQTALGRFLGGSLYFLFPSRRKTALQNISFAFPDYSTQQKQQLLRQSFHALGYSLVEMSIAWFSPLKKLHNMVILEGEKYLKQAKQNGQGVIILLPHYCNMEIIGTLLSVKLPIYVTFHIPQNPAFAHFIDRRRKRTIKNTISSKNLRAMISLLKQKQLLWYAPDQSKYEKKAPYIPFFGKKVKTTTGTAKLAKLTGAQVIPLSACYNKQSNCYTLKFLPPLPFQGKDMEQDTLLVNQAIEQLVYQNPQQYLWVHKRFKDYLQTKNHKQN